MDQDDNVIRVCCLNKRITEKVLEMTIRLYRKVHAKSGYNFLFNDLVSSLENRQKRRIIVIISLPGSGL